MRRSCNVLVHPVLLRGGDARLSAILHTAPVLIRPVVLSKVMIAITLLGLAILYREHNAFISETDSA